MQYNKNYLFFKICGIVTHNQERPWTAAVKMRNTSPYVDIVQQGLCSEVVVQIPYPTLKDARPKS